MKSLLFVLHFSAIVVCDLTLSLARATDEGNPGAQQISTAGPDRLTWDNDVPTDHMSYLFEGSHGWVGQSPGKNYVHIFAYSSELASSI